MERQATQHSCKLYKEQRIRYQMCKWLLNVKEGKIKSNKKWARAMNRHKRRNIMTHQKHKKMSQFSHDQNNAKYLPQ